MDTNQFMIDNATPGVFFDIGACYGQYTVAMASKATRVYAFEPASHNYHRLVDYTKNFPNVVSEKIAVSNSNGTVNLFWGNFELPMSDWGGFSINPEVALIPGLGRSTERCEEVPCISLDEYCKINNITNITGMKIDVEAAEEFVLEGAQNTLRNNNILISLETHQAINRPRIYELLTQAGYAVYLDGHVKVDTVEYDRQYICRKQFLDNTGHNIAYTI